MKLAKWMFSQIQDLQPDRDVPKFDQWANTIRLMRERDGRPLDGIRKVFDLANRDGFWQVNILSPTSLREKYQDLELKLRKSKNGRHDDRPMGKF